MTGERDKGLESESPRQGAHLLDDGGLDLGRMTAGLEQGQDQGGEFVPHGDAGELNPRRFTRATDGEGGPARVLTVVTNTDEQGQGPYVFQQRPHLLRLGAVVEGGDQFDRLLQALKVGLELGLDVGVEH